MADLGRLSDFLVNLCARSGRMSGGQVALKYQDEALESVTFGYSVHGYSLTDRHVFNVWCATKPLVAAIFLAEIERSGHSIHGSVGEIVDVSESLNGISWVSILNHSAGLVRPNLFEVSFRGDVRRTEELAQECVPTSTDGYSDFVGSALLVLACEELTSKTFAELWREFLRGTGLDLHMMLELGPDQLGSPLEKVGFYVLLHQDRLIPLMHDAIRSIGKVRSGAFGGYSSATGLCLFYDLVGSVLRGNSHPMMPSRQLLSESLTLNRGDKVDDVLGRSCDFAGGFMINLSHHDFGDMPMNAFGHSGVLGSPFGFHDPSSGLSAGVVLNGFAPSPRELREAREEIIGLFYEL